MHRVAKTLAVHLLALAVLALAPAAAESPSGPTDAMFDKLRNASSEPAARAAEDVIWRAWMMGPSQEATLLVEKAMERRRWYDFAGALAYLDEAVALAPGWAEPWNQRAFIRFLREEYDESLEDLDRALELEPRHFAALSGKARILMRQGRMELGQQALRKAVEINPYLRERDMLIVLPGEKL